jgi:NhaP-type Na+/H+ or K+/H+ antiporter
MMAIFYPLFLGIKFDVSFSEYIFLTWGGLRGAVGIALALVVEQSTIAGNSIVSEIDGHRVFFIVGGVAGLSLVLNATTAQRLLFSLGLVEETSEEIRIMQHYARKRHGIHIYDIFI